MQGLAVFMNKAGIDKRIAEEAEKLAQQKALLGQLRARKAKIDRKNETRRKILTGAVVLNQAKRDPEFRDQLLEWLDKGLTAARDRALFNFAGDGAGTASNDNVGASTVHSDTA